MLVCVSSENDVIFYHYHLDIKCFCFTSRWKFQLMAENIDGIKKEVGSKWVSGGPIWRPFWGPYGLECTQDPARQCEGQVYRAHGW